MAEIKIVGFKELDKELARLPHKIQKKILRKVVREGAKVVQKQAKANAPVRSKEFTGGSKIKQAYPAGHLKKSIIVRAAKKKEVGKSITGAVVTLRGSAWYGKLVEFGHKLSRNGKEFSSVPPNPFMRRAFDSTKMNVLAKMKTTFLTEIGKYKKG